jgi:phage N-6-adenine-methyltransferase
MKTILQGTAAQNSGKTGEQLIAELFESKNIKVVKYKDFSESEHTSGFIAVRGYPYTNHLKTTAKIDFALLKDNNPIFGIEVKTQEVPGSVDEKLAAVALNGRSSIFPKHICAVLGNHWTYGRGAQWVKTINESMSNKKFSILYYDEISDKIDECLNTSMTKNKADKNQLGYIGKAPGAERDSDSWYTPKKYVESARVVLGGFGLDPFSSELANKTVNAEKFFTVDDDGLAQDWMLTNKKTVWMNPPYGSLMAKSITKFIQEFTDGKFESGIVLCNNATDTQWFAKLTTKASAFCFTSHRIQFENFDGKASSVNTRGQVFVYFGKDTDKFKQEFTQYGHIMTLL